MMEIELSVFAIGFALGCAYALIGALIAYNVDEMFGANSLADSVGHCGVACVLFGVRIGLPFSGYHAKDLMGNPARRMLIALCESVEMDGGSAPFTVADAKRVRSVLEESDGYRKCVEMVQENLLITSQEIQNFLKALTMKGD
jgi:hypothetical protein